jgi:hypothetical protein
MFRKIRNIRNLGNVHIRGPHIVMSRTDAQNELDFHFKINAHAKISINYLLTYSNYGKYDIV